MSIRIKAVIRIVIIILSFTPKDLFAQFIIDHAREEFNRRALEQFSRDVQFEKSKSRFEYSNNSPTNTLTYSIVLKDKKKYWSRLYTDSIFNAKSNQLRQEAIDKGYDTLIINIYYKRDYWYQKYVISPVKP